MRKFFNYSDPEESKRRKQNIILFALIMMLFWGMVSCLAAWQVTKILGVKSVSQNEESPVTHNNAPITDPTLPDTITNSIGMKLKLIQPGTFRMGNPENEPGHEVDETPACEVTLTKPFYIGIYEVTQEQWHSVMGNNPSKFVSPHRPVEEVSWKDTQEFLKRLSEKEKAEYRLPTEAEWEYACRAGSKTNYYWGDVWSDEYGWCDRNSGGKSQEVGMKRPNAWGIFDMSGNVYEWCQDLYDKYPPTSKRVDPKGALNSEYRVLRGGGWFVQLQKCRSANRANRPPTDKRGYVGFRVVREP